MRESVFEYPLITPLDLELVMSILPPSEPDYSQGFFRAQATCPKTTGNARDSRGHRGFQKPFRAGLESTDRDGARLPAATVSSSRKKVAHFALCRTETCSRRRLSRSASILTARRGLIGVAVDPNFATNRFV